MHRIFISLTLVFLASCGGSDGGSNGGGSVVLPPNNAPVFTSAASATVTENSVAVIQSSASDADGNALSYSIVGGSDAALFAITSAGQVTFMSAPSFETPRDSDADNIYAVTIAVSDARVSVNQTVQVTVVNSREGVAVRRLSTQFNAPVAASAVGGGSPLVLVAEKAGSVWLYNPATDTKTLIDTLQNVGQAADQGMLSIAADPAFATNGGFFFSMINANGDLNIRGYAPNALLPAAQDRTGSILFIPGASNSSNRSVALTFGLDLALYAAVGDAGGANDPSGSAQNSSSHLGKLIRIVRNPDPFAGASPQFYLFQTIGSGLRKPGGLLSFGTDIYVSDIGQSRFGEINLRRSGEATRNYGWPFREGTVDNVGTPPAGLSAPVLQVAFGSGRQQGNSIVSGVAYAGTIASLANQMVFGDSGGAIWAVPLASLVDGSTVTASGFERRSEDFAPDAGSINGIAAIISGIVGRILIFDKDGEIFTVEAAV